VTTLPTLADLEGAWRAVAVPMTPYLAASGWRAPVEPAAAASWLLAEKRLSFRHQCGDTCVIASLRRSRSSNAGQMVVLSSTGADFASVGEVLDHMLHVAFTEIGIRRLELTLPEAWVGAAEAARERGFQVEGRFTEACFADGRYRDVLLLGILAGEWRR
jgi:hypothetical protein